MRRTPRPVRDVLVHAGRAGLCVLAAVVAVGCGAHRVAGGTSSAQAPTPGAVQSRSLSLTVETSDQRLAAALLRVTIEPTPAAHREVAREYKRLGVLDRAHEYFGNAVALDPTDGAAYEALARIWRDWGTPQLGLADAYRAVYYAPQSAAAANTLGTLFQALQRLEDAKRWYARALVLDGDAWYALNNLCYAQVMTRQATALETCRRAVAAAPEAKVARNNLALAHTAAGQLDMAMTWFRHAGDEATASYNYGIAMMATGAYEEAVAAFHAALRADPQFTVAAQRARQARMAVRAEDHPE